MRQARIQQPTRVACVGGSITFGLGLANRREQCYPAVLQTLVGDRFHVRNFGYAGAAVGRRTNEPYHATPSMTSAVRFGPHVIVLLLGTNDAQHANREALPQFESELTALVGRFRSLSGRPRLVIGAPPPVFDPLPEIDIPVLDGTIRPAIERTAAALGLPLVYAYTPLRDRPDLFPDNLHPSAEGARILAGAIAAAIG